MNNLTIVTKLRFVAAIAPAVLLIVGALIAGAFHVFGIAPRMVYENQYTASRAAAGMENALYKMDWGRTQPDGTQIVIDQQRGFIGEIETARAHIESREQAERIEKIANDARPLFDTMRSAAPTDETMEPKLRELEGSVADLMSLDDARLQAYSANAESQARTMIAITIAGAILIPWICFVVLVRLSGGLYAGLKTIRQHVEALAERAPAPSDDLRAIDEELTRLGFPKPNPMLAE